MNISEIKKIFENADINEIADLINVYSSDDRNGVHKVVSNYKKELQKYYDELDRLEKISEYENKCYADGYSNICGIDEVGRGPLAGPVCAGVVILPQNIKIMYVNDSKQLTAKMREELYKEIKEKAISAETAFVSYDVIDEINILQATYRAMRQAINKLNPLPDILLNDAVTIPEVNIRQIPIIKGDAKSMSIAAASIIAKVERDRLMEEYDELYPEYGFARNKGYGSKEHIEAIKKYGPCPIHRMSFLKGLLN